MTQKPADLIRPMARWNPGAWTPARCALKRQFDADNRPDLAQRLEEWIDLEKTRTRCHRYQLPDLAESEAA